MTMTCHPQAETSLTGCRTMRFDEFAKMYCEYSKVEKSKFLLALESQKRRENPYGWMMLRCEISPVKLAVIPFGPRSSLMSIPSGPVYLPGLLSGRCTIVAILNAHDPALIDDIAAMRAGEEVAKCIDK